MPGADQRDPDGGSLNPEVRQLVIAMMPQAKSEAWKVFSSAPHALDLDDLTSLAYTGLMAAAVRWPRYCAERDFSPGCGQVPCADPATCGTRYFAAYTLRRIRGSMLDAMRSADWVTRSMRTRVKAIAEADAGYGRPEAELARATGLTLAQVRAAMTAVTARPVSFDAESHDVADDGDTESRAAVSEILTGMLGVLDDLDIRTQVILALRYHQGRDLADIAAALRLTEDQVTAAHDSGVLAIHDVMLRAVTA